MTEKFTGLCLGGPKDGQWFTQTDRVCLVPIYEPLALTQYDTVPMAGMVKTGRYSWMPYYAPNAKGPDAYIGFWLYQGLEPKDIFQLLVEGYRSGVHRSC